MDTTTKTIINGTPVEVSHKPEASAVEVIREKLHLTGTKLSCGSGVCGACTISVDGQPTTACLKPACSLEGKQVETIEKFDSDDLHPVQKAFLANDGLQCGFCTPGFIIEAISFYNRWRSEHGKMAPPRETIAAALAGHLCRCGAYIGIYEAVSRACAGEYDTVETFDFPRHEGIEKVTGRAKYTVDVHYDGMLVAKFLKSPHAHALVKRIDTSQTESIPGVKAIIDVLKDPHRVVRYVGQPILAVAAVDEETAEAALEAIEIDFEERPFVIDPIAARSPNSAEVYPENKKDPPNASEGPIPPGKWAGNVRTPILNKLLSTKKGAAKKSLERARAGEDGLHLIEHTFSTPAQTHTALEPHCCVARWTDEDRLTVHASSQSVHLLGKELTKRYKLKPGDVEVHAEFIGGAFGAKSGMTLEHTTTVDLARKTGAPVKLVYDRLEEMVLGGCRPTSRIDFSLVVDDDANQRGITARAYGSSGVAIQSQNAPWIRFTYEGPKDCEDFDVTINASPAKPFRGPCGPTAFWALEQAVDEAAYRLKLDPIDLRRKWDKSDVRQNLYDWAESIPEWRNRKAANSGSGRFKTGIGLAIGNWFNAFHNATRVKLDASPEGLVASCAVQDMGQGSRSVIAKAIAVELGIPENTLKTEIGNSNLVLGPISSGSRTTASVYPTSIEAAQMMKKKLIAQANSTLGLEKAYWDSGGIRHQSGHISLAELLKILPPISVTSNKRGGNGSFDLLGNMPSGDLGMSMLFKMTGSVCLVEVEVDTRLGHIKPSKVWMGLSVGKITNPELANSQIYGAVVQSLGLTLTEERQYDPTTGTLLSFGLDDYRIPGIGDIPEVCVHYDETFFQKQMRGGACGMSELSNLPVPPALGNAVFNATAWRPTELPLRPHRVIGNV